MKDNKKIKSRKKRLTLHDKALIALKEAVKKVYENAKKHRYPLAVWKDGKVVQIKPWKKRK
jgi:hypothetical protein